MNTQNQNTENTVITENELRAYYIEQVTNNGTTYFQLVRRCDDAILYSNVSLSLVADKIDNPTYKDGTTIYIDMKDELKSIRISETPSKKISMINELAVKISKTDGRFLRISKECIIANEYYFGVDLTKALISRLSNKITNNKDIDFKISDFIRDIEGAIFEVL